MSVWQHPVLQLLTTNPSEGFYSARNFKFSNNYLHEHLPITILFLLMASVAHLTNIQHLVTVKAKAREIQHSLDEWH